MKFRRNELKLPQWIDSWHVPSALLLLGCLLVLVFFSHVNLLFGLEKVLDATLVDHQVLPTARSTQHVLLYRTQEGAEMKTKVQASFVRRAGAGQPGQRAKIKTDGFFWRTIVAVDHGAGFQDIP